MHGRQAYCNHRPPSCLCDIARLKGITERYVILEGRGRVEVDGIPPRELGKGDVVIIPPRAAQRITNTGDTDLVFLAICSPRFVEEAYESVVSTASGNT